MPLSYATYAGNGSTTTFSVPFPYLLKAHVKLYIGYNILNGAYTSELVDGTGFTWTSATQIQCTTAPANGQILTILRQTPSTSRIVDWADGGNLIAADMDTADLQNLYVVQEQQDRNDAGITQSTTAINTANTASTTATNAANSIGGKLDKTGGTMTGAIAMSGNKITGAGDPTAAQDVATKNYTDSQVGAVSASATAAAASAAAAATSATAASASQTAAATSATNAAASATTASTQATNSSNSATAAANSATAAAASQSAAAASQSAAAASAATATTQAGAAATSATNAASAQAAAESARDSALAAYDNFDDRYLGAKASNPTVDNDGNALVAGALYFNTVSQDMRIYTGSAWVSAYANGTTFLQLTGGTMTGAITFAGGQPTATTSIPNIVQLENSTASTSTTTAATPSSVKSAYDLANTANTTANAANTTAGAALPKAGGTMTGAITLAADPVANLQPATKQYVDTAGALKAPLASPTFTGTPAAPTAAAGTNTTQLATTGFVTTNFAALATAQSFTKAQRGTPVALTDAATVAVDLSLGNYYTLTLGGNRTLGAPTNQTAGQSGVIVITQDGTGSRTLAYNSVYKFPSGTAPTLTTTANSVDVLVYYVESATRITCRLLSDLK